MVAPKLSVGGYALLASTGFQNTDVSARSYGFGATVKAHFAVGAGEIRPGLTLALQLSDLDGGDLVKGLDVDVTWAPMFYFASGIEVSL
jgi:hypothetical protein